MRFQVKRVRGAQAEMKNLIRGSAGAILGGENRKRR